MSRDDKFLVVAFGGNAFQTKGEKGTPEDYWRNAYRSAEFLIKIIEEGYKIAIRMARVSNTAESLQ